jgi:hypothetical protein
VGEKESERSVVESGAAARGWRGDLGMAGMPTRSSSGGVEEGEKLHA